MSDPQVPLAATNPIQSDFRVFLDAEADAMLVVDAQGRIILTNHPSEQLFGYSDSELVGQKVEILVPPRFRSQHIARREGYFARNPHVRPIGAGLDLSAVRKDGSEFRVEISLSPIQTPDGMMVLCRVKSVPAFWERLESEMEKLFG